MVSDSDLLPISALQHLVYCERQAMLIHLEAAWAENKQTAEGRRLHDRTHREASRMEDGKLVARGLRLVSYRLGLVGAADVVEFHPCAASHESGATCISTSKANEFGDSSSPLAAETGMSEPGIALPGRRGRWNAYPVEYKRGGSKKNGADEVQLCAQALCLEEMLRVCIPSGALFYGRTRRRKEVPFDPGLRSRVEACAKKLHELFGSGVTPLPVYEKKKCERCSLLPQCMPNRPASASNYLKRMIARSLLEA